MSTIRTSSSRWLLLMAVAVVVLVVVSLVVTLAGPQRGAETFTEDVPEGVVQRFIVAIQEQDFPLAHSYLNEELRDACTVEYMRNTTQWLTQDREQGLRVALLGKKVLSNGDTQVRVRVTRVNVSPPFGVNEESHDELYVLAQEDSQWRFQAPPWPVGYCPGIETAPKTPAPAAGG